MRAPASIQFTSRTHSQSGITALELMIVVLIVGVIAAIALPAYVRARERTQNVRTVGDLKAFGGQLEIFNSEMRRWPDDKIAGKLPDRIGGSVDNQLEQSIKKVQFESRPAIGGEFDWDLNLNSIHAAVGVANPTATVAQLTALDTMLDDGVLTTGFFRTVPNGVMYVLQQNATGH